MADNLDANFDKLYGAGLDAFTRERDAVAKQLRADGDKEAADAVKALHKPTVSAWAINQLARHARKDVDALLDAGHRLREAQRALMARGDQKAFVDAKDRHARALGAVMTKAGRLLEKERGAASEPVLDRIRTTLQSASVTDEGRALLAQGRLTEDLAPTGFEALGSVESAPPAPQGKTSAEERREQIKGLEERLRKARDEAHALNEAACDAEAAASATHRNADSAQAKAERADIAVRELEAQLRKARSTSS